MHAISDAQPDSHSRFASQKYRAPVWAPWTSHDLRCHKGHIEKDSSPAYPHCRIIPCVGNPPPPYFDEFQPARFTVVRSVLIYREYGLPSVGLTPTVFPFPCHSGLPELTNEEAGSSG
uniref:Uncharacterized protein n=1 Tax=Schistocephalus solidus TaxID=70667 RepID=A0A0X3NLT0_SCHSO